MERYEAKPRLSFKEALQSALKTQSSSSRRRVRRSEYWWCMLAIAIYYALLALTIWLLEDCLGMNITGWVARIVFTIFSCIPVGLWVMENYGRLHDTNHRDSWLMGVIVPILLALFGHVLSKININSLPASMDGIWIVIATFALLGMAFCFGIVCIYFCLQDSDKGENNYGYSPKYTKITEEKDHE